jgi:hypothetical protein
MTNDDNFIDNYNKWLQKIEADRWVELMDEYAKYYAALLLPDPTAKTTAEEYLMFKCENEIYAGPDADALYEQLRDERMD